MPPSRRSPGNFDSRQRFRDPSSSRGVSGGAAISGGYRQGGDAPRQPGPRGMTRPDVDRMYLRRVSALLSDLRCDARLPILHSFTSSRIDVIS